MTVVDAASTLGTEWLLTDGRGGYAASTPSGVPTRRYHGLLVSAFPGTAKRHVFLSRFDEQLDGVALTVARQRDDHVQHAGRAPESFDLAPHPVAAYATPGGRLTREVLTAPGRRAVLVRYALSGTEGAGGAKTLELRPVLPFREADALTVENGVADATTARLARGLEGVAWRLYPALPTLSLTSSRPFETTPDPVWLRDLDFEADRARGYDGREDELSPAVLRTTLAPGEAWVLAASVEEPLEDPAALWDELAREAAKRPTDGLEARLDRAADDFLYRGDDGRIGVVAGFPWFGEWGRDTFLSLPGLTLARGRTQECEEVLVGALPYLKEGLLPNIFGTSAEDSHYGSADAALWWARAVQLFGRAGGSQRTLRTQLRPALVSIGEAYLEGTGLGLRFDDDGLLAAGSPERNPTWMDAQTSTGPVTPRHGYPVEITALGYSLLAQLEQHDGKRWTDLRRHAKRSFLERFWLPEERYLVDVWRPGGRGQCDLSVRPNMVLAAALELSPLTKAQRADIVERARKELLTPRGLRTLSPRDPDYVGRYGGGPEERDAAYHQGTVWPWLLGSYTEASLRAVRPTAKLRKELDALWKGLVPELDRAGLGHVSEVFDGDEPQEPGGTFAQAWNTAEWLRSRHMLAEGLR